MVKGFLYCSYLMIAALAVAGRGLAFAPPQDTSSIWVTAYYAGWSQGWYDNGVLPTQNIDYTAVTHIIHFALVPGADGSLDSTSNSILPQNSAALIGKAHAAGKKVLICVGGWGSDAAFRGATSLLNLLPFVTRLVKFMTSRGYDGIDIDWEVLDITDAAQYTLFIQALRTQLDLISPRPLLTVATTWAPTIFTSLLSDIDQINIMTYDMSGSWPGWVVWHNAPLLDGGFVFPSTGRPVPSAAGLAQTFLEAGIPLNKLGIGIDFYGYVWSGGAGTSTGGATQPRQTWTSPPQVSPNVPYYTIIQDYYQPQYYRWDSLADASYLSIDNPGSQDDKFISYDDEAACTDKVNYAKTHGLGGVIIWELGGGYLPQNYANRDRLLQAIKNAANNVVQTLSAPTLESPQQRSVGVPIHSALTWDQQPGAVWYRLEVARDSTFSSPVLDQRQILVGTFRPAGLNTNTMYFWRVEGSNSLVSSPWSRTSTFTTTADTLLPASWMFISNTGSNASVLIPVSANPTIGGISLQSGDAIGVFFESGQNLRCGGYGLWENGQNLVVTLWGDDPQTIVKDGFTPGDTIRFRIWDHKNHRDYPAQASYRQGNGTYSTDGIFSLNSLNVNPNAQERIPLVKGWNMISSDIRPNDSSLTVITAGIRPNMVMMKDNAGNVFWPDSGVNTIGHWSVEQGYQIYTTAPDTLTLTGAVIAPETNPVSLIKGWNMTAYLRDATLDPDSALVSIDNSLTIVKDNLGMVYWPAFGINTMGPMIPGQGYKIYVSQPTTLTYPPNSVSQTIQLRRPSAFLPGIESSAQRHYPEVQNTSNSSVVLFKSSEMHGGDEIAIVSSSGRFVGTGKVENGKCVIAIWGNDNLTASPDGATEGEQLYARYWSSARRSEDSVAVDDVSDAIFGRTLGTTLTYHPEAVLTAGLRLIPASFYVAQNFPNPFNPSTTIRYGITEKSVVHLEIFNVLGQSVGTVTDGVEDPGFYEVVWTPNHLASGVYFSFIHVVSLAGPRQYSDVKKLLYVK